MSNVVSVKKLKESILKNEKLFPGDKLSKERLFEIAGKYNLSTYVLAVYVFHSSQPQYAGLLADKSNANNIIILKDEIPEMIEDANNKKETIIKNESLKKGDLIDYSRLQELSVKYNISEKILALNVLLITERSYENLRSKKDYKSKIFLEEEINNIAIRDEETNRLRNEILKNEKLKIEDRISYDIVKNISKKYNIDELKLVYDIFGIKKSIYYQIKYKEDRTAVILNNFLTKEELEETKEKIIAEENIGNTINYEELVRISNKYLLNEQLLAKKIFGLTASQFHCLKILNSNAVVLKDERKTRSKSELRILRYKIFKKEYLNYGDFITYNRIIELQNKYSLQIEELLYILGVSINSYRSIKYGNHENSIIKNSEYYSISMILLELLEKEKYYTSEELEELCSVNNIPFKFFYYYVIGTEKYKSFEICKKELSKYGRIYIGKNKILEDTQEKYEKNNEDNKYDKELIRDYYYLKIAEGYNSDLALRLTAKSYDLDKVVIMNIIQNKDDKVIKKVLKVS